MTIYNWTSLGFPAPAMNTRQIASRSGVLESSFTGAVQIIQRPTYWLMQATWNLHDANFRKDLLSFLLSIDKTEHLLMLPYFGHVQRGAFGGSPLVAGGSQTGRTVAIDGAAFSVTNWVRAGDWLRFGASSSQGYMVSADANSDGAGLVSVSLTQALLQSPINNEAVTTSAASASLIACRCLSVAQWEDQRVANSNLLTQISAQFVQDVLTL